MGFGTKRPPFGFGTVGGWQSESGGTTTGGGTGTSPGTTTSERWPPGVIPPTKWCVKETSIWGSMECIPPDPLPPAPPSDGSRALAGQSIGDPPPEKRIKITVDWQVKCVCTEVTITPALAGGQPTQPYEPPIGGRLRGGHCKNGKRDFHFFDINYEYDCRPISGGSSGQQSEDTERARWVTTRDIGCKCNMGPPIPNYPSNCFGKRTIILDLRNPHEVIFRVSTMFHSNGGQMSYDPNTFPELDPPDSDPSMKLALDKCKVKKIPMESNPSLFYYKIEDYDDGSRSSQDQIDCLNDLLCCEEGEEDSPPSSAPEANSVIKRLINFHVRSLLIPPFLKCTVEPPTSGPTTGG